MQVNMVIGEINLDAVPPMIVLLRKKATKIENY